MYCWILNYVWCLNGFRQDSVSYLSDSMVALSDNMFAFSDNVVILNLHVNCPVCTCVKYIVHDTVVAHQCSVAFCV